MVVNTLNLDLNIYDCQDSDILSYYYYQSIINTNKNFCYTFEQHSDVPYSVFLNHKDYLVMGHAQTPYNVCILLSSQENLILIKWNRKSKTYTFSIGHYNQERIEEIKQMLLQIVPVSSTPDDKFPLEFWFTSVRGPTNLTRNVELPLWNDIKINYSLNTQNNLNAIMALTPPLGGGKLILFHGKPGTGKTFAIRSLLQQWRTWCQSKYIMDPEKFFDDPSYMNLVLIEDDIEVAEHYDSPDEHTPPSEAKVKKWKLLIIEDSDEFLGVDAKRQTGQSLSRLLNITDGLIGQGLNLLVLITTNEPLEKINPAVSRAGRCLANIQFTELDAKTADIWRGIHNQPITNKSALLADLYNQLNNNNHIQIPNMVKIGFKSLQN